MFIKFEVGDNNVFFFFMYMRFHVSGEEKIASTILDVFFADCNDEKVVRLTCSLSVWTSAHNSLVNVRKFRAA